ncbi:NAD(P)-dependent alcohol dehydrogenase [Demequina sp.]|uniref:NAD(P)-dependent alcohol dehydrogenase n=1 Tax=Demequina sp. TaxID=2050685 RepID=UPI0025BE808E|nr:NAD(P)-dependent alcohol dehydrogenase [Demequina sp.]
MSPMQKSIAHQAANGSAPSAAPATMTAARHVRFATDPAKAVALAEAPLPQPGPGQVRLKVAAAGISIGDWLTMTGLPFIARPSFGFLSPKKPVLGQELAGTVDAVGKGVEGIAPGDQVFGFAEGAFAEYAIASAEHLVRTPEGVNAVQAAAVPVSALAAYQALTKVGRTARGSRVLVIGASGAVGTYAVQIAAALGAEVTGVAAAANAAMVRDLGAAHVVDYAATDVTASGQTYDVVVDTVGTTPLRALAGIVAKGGKAVLVGSRGGRAFMGFGRTIRAIAFGPLFGGRLAPLFSMPHADDLVAVRDLLANGTVTPRLDRTFPLTRLADALTHVGSRRTQGKSVVVIGD